MTFGFLKNSPVYLKFEGYGIPSGSNYSFGFNYGSVYSKSGNVYIMDLDYDNSQFKEGRINKNGSTNGIVNIYPSPQTLKRFLIKILNPNLVYSVQMFDNQSVNDPPDIQNLINLESIDFRYNRGGLQNNFSSLSRFNILNLPRLKTIFLENSSGTGKLPAIDFKNNSLINNINLISIGLQSIEGLQNKGSLDTIVLHKNKLTSIDLTGCNSLRVLELGNGGSSGGQDNAPTGISIVGLETCTSLVRLWADACRLKNFNLPIAPGLTSLIINSNLMETLDISMLPGIQYVDARFGNINSFVSSPSISFVTLQIVANKLSSIDVSSSTNLVSLFIGDGSSSGQNPSGGICVISGTSNKFNLTNLYFNHSKVTTFPDIAGSPNIQDLRFHVNNVSTVDLSSLVNLQTIYCFGNKLGLSEFNKIIQKTTLKNLYFADGSSTSQNVAPNLTSVDLSDLVNLENVNLNNCGLSGTLVLPASNNLTNIRIQNNPLLTELVFPPGTSVFGEIKGNNNLALLMITNLEAGNFPDGAGVIDFSNCKLNITFPLGTVPYGIKARTIFIQNNSMSKSNVHATINNLWANRGNVNATTTNGFNNTILKSLNISGTNASPDGIFQMPVQGYSGVIHDKSESELNVAANSWTEKEKIWVLMNLQVSSSDNTKRYKWNIIFTPS